MWIIVAFCVYVCMYYCCNYYFLIQLTCNCFKVSLTIYKFIQNSIIKLKIFTIWATDTSNHLIDTKIAHITVTSISGSVPLKSKGGPLSNKTRTCVAWTYICLLIASPLFSAKMVSTRDARCLGYSMATAAVKSHNLFHKTSWENLQI